MFGKNFRNLSIVFAVFATLLFGLLFPAVSNAQGTTRVSTFNFAVPDSVSAPQDFEEGTQLLVTDSPTGAVTVTLSAPTHFTATLSGVALDVVSRGGPFMAEMPAGALKAMPLALESGQNVVFEIASAVTGTVTVEISPVPAPTVTATLTTTAPAAVTPLTLVGTTYVVTDNGAIILDLNDGDEVTIDVITGTMTQVIYSGAPFTVNNTLVNQLDLADNLFRATDRIGGGGGFGNSLVVSETTPGQVIYVEYRATGTAEFVVYQPETAATSTSAGTGAGTMPNTGGEAAASQTPEIHPADMVASGLLLLGGAAILIFAIARAIQHRNANRPTRKNK